MKNEIIISTDNDDLVSSVDDGTNTLFINDTEIPSTDWVGTGNYTTTVEGHSVTIAKIASLTGNVMIERVSSFSYRLVAVNQKYPVYQDAEGNVTVSGNITDGSGNVLSNKAEKITANAWNGSTDIPDKTIESGTSWQNIGSIFIKEGKYLGIIQCIFASNNNGRRAICLSNTSGGNQLNNFWRELVAPVNGNVTTVRMVAPINITNDDTYYINAAQTSGSSLLVSTRYAFIKLG